MNKKTKPMVYKILREDKKAREDDNYLIWKVICNLCQYDAGVTFISVLTGMKVRGISFESITRARRKFFEENPEYREPKIEAIRRQEEENYFVEYGNHIPRIDYNL